MNLSCQSHFCVWFSASMLAASSTWGLCQTCTPNSLAGHMVCCFLHFTITFWHQQVKAGMPMLWGFGLIVLKCILQLIWTHCCDALTVCTGCQLLRKTGRFWRDPAIGSSCWPASPSHCSWSSQHVWRHPMTFRCSFSSWAMDLLTKVIVELIHAGLKKWLPQTQPEEIFSI